MVATSKMLPQAEGAGIGADEPAPEMAFAIHPPIHVLTHPDEPIRSVGAAAAFIKRHHESAFDPAAQAVLKELELATTPGQAEAAGRSFRNWAQHAGLLLVPPEDRGRR
jgi:hypothetical protein